MMAKYRRKSRSPAATPTDTDATLRDQDGWKLDFLVTLLKTLKDAAEMAPVPVLKGAIGTASGIVELLQSMRSNREECYSILKLLDGLCKPMIEFMGKCKDSEAHLSEDHIESFKSALANVKNRLDRITTQDTPRNFWKLLIRTPSNKTILLRCRGDIQDAFMIFMVRDNLTQRNDQLGDADIETVNRAQISLEEPLTPSIFRAHLDHDHSKCVIVKKYAPHSREKYKIDLEHWMAPNNWHPYLLQVFKKSPKNARDLFIVFRDPGASMQSMVKGFCERLWNQNKAKATDDLLSMINTVMEATKSLAKEKSGGFRLKDAEVYVRPGGSPVLANWDPSPAQGDDDIEEIKKAEMVWDEMVLLLSKCLTGDASKPNYVLGQYGSTGPAVTRTVKHLLHFLWGFRYSVDMEGGDDPMDHLFDVFSNAVDDLRADVLKFLMDDNPIRSALIGRYSPQLFGIWDFWKSLDVEPGDIGYLVRGSDPLRPTFRRLFNVAEDAQNNPYHWEVENIHGPEPEAWSLKSMPGDIIRHSLKFNACNEPGPPESITFYKAFVAANLNRHWDGTYAWKYLRDNADSLVRRAQAENTEHPIDVSDLVLIFSRSQALPYSFIRFPGVKSPEKRDQLLYHRGFKDGEIHFFETPQVGEGHVEGYWSADSEPGHPIWPPVSDAEGSDWGWEIALPGIWVEASRKGPEQHIRYLHL